MGGGGHGFSSAYKDTMITDDTIVGLTESGSKFHAVVPYPRQMRTGESTLCHFGWPVVYKRTVGYMTSAGIDICTKCFGHQDVLWYRHGRTP